MAQFILRFAWEHAFAYHQINNPAGANSRETAMWPSKIFGSEASFLADLGKRSRSYFFAVVKAEGEVRPTRSLELSV